MATTCTQFNFTLIQILFLSFIFVSWLVNSKFQLGNKYITHRFVISKTKPVFHDLAVWTHNQCFWCSVKRLSSLLFALLIILIFNFPPTNGVVILLLVPVVLIGWKSLWNGHQSIADQLLACASTHFYLCGLRQM